jgi:hypothetical protein
MSTEVPLAIFLPADVACPTTLIVTRAAKRFLNQNQFP